LGDNGGPTALLKAGTGTWTVSGVNSFSGGTTVSRSVLTVSTGGTLGTGNLTVSNGATCIVQNAGAIGSGASIHLNGTLNLAYTGTNTVAELYFGGVLQPAGVWNATRSAAYLAGSGSLLVTGGSIPGPTTLTVSALSASHFQLMWTNSALNLYYAANLTTTNWTQVTNQLVLADGQLTVTLPIGTNQAGFYQLHP
jgi:autotransporter-associated beta strand protein